MKIINCNSLKDLNNRNIVLSKKFEGYDKIKVSEIYESETSFSFRLIEKGKTTYFYQLIK